MGAILNLSLNLDQTGLNNYWKGARTKCVRRMSMTVIVILCYPSKRTP